MIALKDDSIAIDFGDLATYYLYFARSRFGSDYESFAIKNFVGCIQASHGDHIVTDCDIFRFDCLSSGAGLSKCLS